jgi:HNH endonuclease
MGQSKKAFLQLHPHCAACSKSITVGEMNVHHIIPYHYCIEVGRPDLELDIRNLITLCANTNGYEHHLLIGHLGDWQSYNPNIIKDIVTYRGKTYEQITGNKAWNEKRTEKPKHLTLFTDQDKQAFKVMLDKMYPVK